MSEATAAEALARGAPPQFVRARALFTAARDGEAVAALRACIADVPTFLPAYHMLGEFLTARGATGAAADVLARGMAVAGDGGGRRLIAPAFARAICVLLPEAYHPQLERDLLACLAVPEVDHQMLARPAARLLLLKHPADAGRGAAAERRAADPLWIAFLLQCINVDPAMERELTQLRGGLLHAGDRGWNPERVRFIAALAVQAFAGEYCWAVGDGEPALLSALADAGDAPVLLRALYASPASMSVDARRQLRDAAVGAPADAPIAMLVSEAMVATDRERALAASMPRLIESDAAGDATSAVVRAQYEANPYPRWRTPPAQRALALDRQVRSLPKVDRAALPNAIRRVLVAGCGTGFEPIDLAMNDPSLEITALDLSRASLAYGQRKAEALGVDAITWVAGDLLDLPACGQRFDLVTSTGVIHHMADPAAGLAALRDVLSPGGVLRIALYSERARAAVRAAAEAINELQLRPTPDGIRAFRAEVLQAATRSPLAALRDSDDFYSLSGCRDLAFHVQEKGFSLPEVRELLARAGLRLIGFDVPPAARQASCELSGSHADPLDLDHWDAIEARDPSLFAGMYQLWCQRAAEG